MAFSFTPDDIRQCLIIDGSTVMTTVTNSGYLLYTLNMLKSLRSSGLDKKVFIISMDEKGACILRQKGYSAISVEKEDLKQFSPWNSKGYDQICYVKLQVIHYFISLGRNVLLMDGDIVFKQNPINEIRKWVENMEHDVWIQNDSEQNANHENMCTGYLFIRANMLMHSLYDCNSDQGRKKYEVCAFDNNDQTYFNKFVKPYCRMKALPLEQYPNGNVFYNHANQLKNTSILVHFNWVKGHLKMAKMKEHKLWLLTEEEEEVV
uniref:Nucleotide-diphospho-sugar transferase domain-containing protein n=1 Tax=viral metagenome TaxID=1070528 RepID=A0A6C0KWJ5_9ZZZZ